MTITFENDNDVIVYALERIIAYARRSRQIFVAQCVWLIAPVIGLEEGLIIYIDNLQGRDIWINPEVLVPTQGPQEKLDLERRDKVLKECEEFLQSSRRLRGISRLTASTKTKTGQINPTKS
jgi:hypothetical protein